MGMVAPTPALECARSGRKGARLFALKIVSGLSMNPKAATAQGAGAQRLVLLRGSSGDPRTVGQEDGVVPLGAALGADVVNGLHAVAR
jgi:hypothetical protein